MGLTTDTVPVSKEDASAAVTAAAFTTDTGRRIVHCMVGFIGADWDLDEALKEIAGSVRCEWSPHLLDHDLAVHSSSGRGPRRFAVSRPA